MLNFKTPQERSEIAKKANATRKRRKQEEAAYNGAQQAAREEAYDALTAERRIQLEEGLSLPFVVIDSEYEEVIDKFFEEKKAEVADSLRQLLRKGFKAYEILASLEQSDDLTFNLGVYGFTVDAKEILEDVILEEEFYSQFTSVGTYKAVEARKAQAAAQGK